MLLGVPVISDALQESGQLYLEQSNTNDTKKNKAAYSSSSPPAPQLAAPPLPPFSVLDVPEQEANGSVVVLMGGWGDM